MMPKDRPKQTSRVILSIPLTLDLKAELERRAGRQPVSAYARGVLFPANDNAPRRPRIPRHCRSDRQDIRGEIMDDDDPKSPEQMERYQEEISEGMKELSIAETMDSSARLEIATVKAHSITVREL